MLYTFTTILACLRTYRLSPLSLLIGLTIASHNPSFGDVPPGNRPIHRLPSRAGAVSEGPLLRDRFGRIPTAGADPIRFTLRCNKETVRLGESVDLIITAELLTISPNLLFSLPGANAYRLKLLVPAGFVQTGGDFSDYVGDELAYPSRTVATYHLTGYFTSVPAGPGFRLLRSHAQADGQSLFVEKATINLKSAPTGTNPPVAKSRPAGRTGATPVLYVVSETTPSGARIAAANYMGYLEFANCDLIGGWVADLNTLDKSVSLDIYVNGAKATTIIANQDRQDVADARRSTFNKYGFRWVVPDMYKRNAPLTFAVRVTGAPVELSGSPVKTAACTLSRPPQDSCRFTLTTATGSVSTSCNSPVTLRADCQGNNCDKVSYIWSGNGLSQTGQSATFQSPAINGQYIYKVTAALSGCVAQTATTTVTVSGCVSTVVPNYWGFLDSVSCDSLRGWAFDFNALQKSVSVDVFINGTKLTTVLANERRPDVAGAYNVPNFDQYGYRLAIPDSLRRNAPLTIGVRIAESTYELSHSPLQTGVCPGPGTPPPPLPAPPPTPVSCGRSVTLTIGCQGDNCDQMQYAWTGHGINLSGQSVSFIPPAANGTYSYTVTATRPGCPPQTAVASVIVSGCTPTPPPPVPTICSFSIVAPSTSASCGSSVTLNADCLSDNCDQVQYAWVGQGLSRSGQSISFTAPAANGTYSYTVTATRAGCPPQIAVSTVTVSGCAGSPPPPPTPTPCSFSLTAPSTSINCRSSVTLQAYCQGDSCDRVQYNWAGQGISQGGQSFTVTPPATNGTYSYTVTATRAGCSPQIAVATVTVSGCAGPTPPTPPTPALCSFSVVAPSTNVGCSSVATLRADCAGDSCGGVQYAWVGQGLSQSGQSLSFTAPVANGTYSYTVTATRSGCAAQTAVATVTVSGCTPPAPGGYPILDSPQPADKRPVLDNGRIRLAIDLGVGGVIREVTDLQVGENMINCMVKSNGQRDPGRDDQISLYGLPSDSRGWTVNGKPVLEDIGYNPVQGGDVAGNFSPILGYGRTPTMLYSKTRGLHWGINNEPGDYVVEQWIRLEDNIVRRHVRITGDRPDQTRYPEARQQELPCTYTNSAYYQYYVVQGEPYTNAPLVNVNTIPNLTGTGRLDQHTGGTNGPYNIDASEPWIVAVRPNTNRGIALHTPYSHEFKVGLFNSIGYGPAESDGAGYISNGMSLILDRDGVYEFDVNMVVGTLGEIRNTVNTLPRSETRPSYVFDGSPTRHGFYYRKGYDQGFPIANELAITPTDRRFKIISPRKAYRASSVDTLYVRMRASTPETRLILEWRKVGQSELLAAQAGQTITFNITGDNQYRTIAIPVKNHPLWNGLINDFAIRYTIQTETPISNQQVGIKWISATNLGIP